MPYVRTSRLPRLAPGLDRAALVRRIAPSSQNRIADYHERTYLLKVQNAVQRRLGIPSQLSPDDIYSFYEICRFYRSWTQNLKSPWCAVFSDEDLVVLEYRDDVRHYHRNGYGSWVSISSSLVRIIVAGALYEITLNYFTVDGFGLPLTDFYEVGLLAYR